ncbi:facilitated trehalose transporter Tret1-like [Diabrotica undecimpunctata]|uniref:facilitated trehalose transporter Tret1-like n=1 Tax=Diabrotica undecimpunctata TaxID=50387 RepID=UPI003B63421D
MKVLGKSSFLYFCGFAVNIVIVCLGSMMVYTSPVILKLQSNNTVVNPIGRPITVWEFSLFIATYPLGLVTGSILIAKVPDIIGRKRTLISIASCTLISFIGLFLARDIYSLFIFKFTVSLSLGGGPILIPTYTAEIAEDHNRGRLGFFMTLAMTVGQLYGTVIGAFTSVNVFSLLCGLPALLCLICCFWLPESPEYLLTKGRKREAIVVLSKLGKTKNISDIENELFETQNMLQINISTKNSFFKRLRDDKAIKRGFYLAASIMIIEDSIGISIITGLLGPLLNKSVVGLSGDILAIILIIIKFVAVIIATSIVERVGRRILILMATFMAGLSMLFLGLYFYFEQNNYNIPNVFKFVPLLCVSCYFIVFAIGLTSVPYILIAELLPSDIRSVGSSICQLFGEICMISTTFLYPVAAKYFGVHYCMFFFSFVGFSGFSYLYFSLPETKGKSFLEIRKILSD